MAGTAVEQNVLGKLACIAEPPLQQWDFAQCGEREVSEPSWDVTAREGFQTLLRQKQGTIDP